jgi:hypothetical protein
MGYTITKGNYQSFFSEYIVLHVHTLLGNVLANKFPRRQILGKESVAMFTQQ